MACCAVPVRFRLYRATALTCPAAPQAARSTALAATAAAAVAAAVARTGGVPAVPGAPWKRRSGARTDGAARDVRRACGAARDGRRACGAARDVEHGTARRSAPNRAEPSTVPSATGAIGARRPRRTARREDAGDDALEPPDQRAPADPRDLIHGVGTSPGALQRVIDRGHGAVSSGCHRASTHVRFRLTSRWWDLRSVGRRVGRSASGRRPSVVGRPWSAEAWTARGEPQRRCLRARLPRAISVARASRCGSQNRRKRSSHASTSASGRGSTA